MNYQEYSPLALRFHSINVPSEWGLLRGWKHSEWENLAGFHSINVPSEWGHIMNLEQQLLEEIKFPFN
jgi:hypothetical protein